MADHLGAEVKFVPKINAEDGGPKILRRCLSLWLSSGAKTEDHRVLEGAAPKGTTASDPFLKTCPL